MNKITQHIKLALLLLVFAGGISVTSLQAQTSICVGDDILLNLTGYTGTIQWKFSQLGLNGPYNSLPGGSGDSVAFTPTITTWFFAEVTDGACGPFYSDTIQVSLFVPPSADAGAGQTVCEGDSAMLGGSPTGSSGTAPLTYSWTPTTGFSNPTGENPMASPPVSTQYLLTITDANGCTAIDSALVSINLPPDANAGADSTIACGGTLVLSGSATGTGPFSYAWSPASSLTNPNTQTPTATPAGPTTYTLAVTDANGCTGTDTVLINTSGGGVSGSDTIMYSGGIVNYAVPSGCTGLITIEVWGAEGGFGSSSNIQPGLGAYQKGDFNLAAGTPLLILVGQRPPSGNGGGGGTFVVDSSTTNPIIIAGGGGGGAQTTDDNNKQGQAGTSGATGGAGGGAGGTSGSGGSIGTVGFQSGAGGGLLTDGTNGWSANTGGLAFVNGGTGGTTGGAPGGFGGGGSGSGYVVGGGGGGYSGGGSGGNNPAGVGGGAGSFNGGSNPTSTSGLRAGNGMIIITY